MKELCTVCKVPALREYGIDREEFLNLTDKMAEDALASGSPQNLRKSVKKSDIIRIYKKLWENA